MKLLESSRVALKNILFATDFSACSDAALPYVESIARRYGAKIYLAHVVSAQSYAFLTSEAGAAAFETVQQTAEEQLAELSNSPALRSFPRETLLAEGDIVEALRDMVLQHGIDLIVLGTHGRHGLNRFVLGSVADSITRLTPCPVLTVGPLAPHEVRDDATVRRILFATDFTPESAGALEHALSLAQEDQAKLTLLSVLADDEAGEPYRAALMKATLRRLRNMAPPEAALWCEPEFTVDFGPAADVILKHAREGKADLIVLGVRGAGAFPRAGTHQTGRVTYQVVSQAPCAVLVVPAHCHVL